MCIVSTNSFCPDLPTVLQTEKFVILYEFCEILKVLLLKNCKSPNVCFRLKTVFPDKYQIFKKLLALSSVSFLTKGTIFEKNCTSKFLI